MMTIKTQRAIHVVKSNQRIRQGVYLLRDKKDCNKAEEKTPQRHVLNIQISTNNPSVIPQKFSWLHSLAYGSA